MTTKITLANLVVSAAQTEYTVPMCPGMTINLAYANKTLLNNIRNSSLVQKFDPETGTPFKELDVEQYVPNYAAAVIKGWKGFTYRHLASLVLIDETAVDMDAEIPYDADTAVFLLQNCPTIDAWIVNTAKQLANFRK